MSIFLRQVIVAASPQLHRYQAVSCRNTHRWLRATLQVLKRRKDKQDFFYKGPPRVPNHRNTYLEWNYASEVYSFGKRLGENLDGDLLRQALIDRSYILQETDKLKAVGIEDPKFGQDNSEMANEGENLMSDFIISYLRVAFPRLPEEGICAIRDHLMEEETLAEIANLLGTSEIIMCKDHPVENGTLAKTLKAVVACVSRSSGLSRAKLFIRDLILPKLAGKDVSSIWWLEDPLTPLKTILKNEGRPDPEPRLIGESAKNTMFANFRVGLYVNKELLSTGSGETISTACEIAAHNALRSMFGITEKDRAFPLYFDVDKIPSSSKNPSLVNWSSKLFSQQDTKRIASSA
nr:PREDICTED: 39S ribosomal protein L44, mitochondrial [Bemisia tabaci]